jgi:hypothetical protein
VAVLVLGFLLAACTASPSATKDAGPSGGRATTTTTSGNGHPSDSGTTSTTAPPVAADVVADRAAVPWSQLGPGWLLATWSPNTTSVTGQGTSSATLFLVDPAGGRYDLGPAPAGRLVDWSGNGADALFLGAPPSGTVGPSAIVVEDLRNGSEQRFSTPTGATVFQVQFSKPDGKAVLVAGVDGAPARRYGLSGTLEETYPVSLPGETTASKASGMVVETPAGTELVLQASGGFDVVTNGGAPVRFLPLPPGQSACELDGWWDGEDILETCINQLYAQPVTGGPASLVAAGATGGDYIDAWTVGGQVVAEAGACGTTWLVKVGTTGAPQPVTVPNAGSVAGIGAAGDELAILVTPSCDEATLKSRHGNLLEWYAPSSDRLDTVLGGAFGGGTVDAAVELDDR